MCDCLHTTSIIAEMESRLVVARGGAGGRGGACSRVRGLLWGEEHVLELDRAEHHEHAVTGFFTLKWLIFCYVNLISINFFLKESKKTRGKGLYKQWPAGDQGSGLSSATFRQRE